MSGGVSSNHQNFNLLNITNIGKPGLKGQMKVPVSDVGRDLVIDIFDLKTPAADGEKSRLTKALLTLVEQSGVSIKFDGYSTEGDVLKAIGKHIMVKQGVEGGGDAQPLSSEEKTLLQNLEIVMKAARKIMKEDPSVTFDCFNEFNRHSRYSYKDEGGNPKIESTSRSDGKDATSWTSYFKDALAFDSIKFGGSGNNNQCKSNASSLSG